MESVQDLLARFGPQREIVIARELTKKFEEVARMKLADAPAWLESSPQRVQGEFVLVLQPGPARAQHEIDAERVLQALLAVMGPSEAAKVAAKITGLPRRLLYEKALAKQE
jgi:16S rRNA (cytidine1402-2'-O)-methyltransferase